MILVVTCQLWTPPVLVTFLSCNSSVFWKVNILIEVGAVSVFLLNAAFNDSYCITLNTSHYCDISYLQFLTVLKLTILIEVGDVRIFVTVFSSMPLLMMVACQLLNTSHSCVISQMQFFSFSNNSINIFEHQFSKKQQEIKDDKKKIIYNLTFHGNTCSKYYPIVLMF